MHHWQSYGADFELPARAPGWMPQLLTDLPTGNGLLVACDPQAARAVIDTFTFRHGFADRATARCLALGAARLPVA